MSLLPRSIDLARVPDGSRLASRSTIAAGLIVVIFAIAALWPSLLSASSPIATDPGHVLAAPSLTHWMGTDQVGRDVFARVVFGTGPSLLIGLGATILGAAVGGALGMLSALGGTAVDGVVMRFADILLAFPTFLLALLIVALAGPGTLSALLAIAFATAPGYARLLRGQARAVIGTGYVAAATALGTSWPRVVVRHVVPNSMKPMLVLATLGLGEAIVAGASLSFLGLGPLPPSPQWGSMLSDGSEYLGQAWWIALFPGIAILLAVSTLTLLGRALQARIGGETTW
jgi:peptide/nickel transport system permease protein